MRSILANEHVPDDITPQSTMNRDQLMISPQTFTNKMVVGAVTNCDQDVMQTKL